ncbi:MAG: hypothetical protein PQJ59_05460 [Spirochaetales bacterium]|nr:hypothetical protein [Spirochaetales bacterium]
MKRFFLFILILLPLSLSGISVEKGNLKVVADDETGGYLCYARLSDQSPWYPLYVESFTSSYIQLKLNDENVFPGGSPDYDLRFDQVHDSLSIIYEGSEILLIEKISLSQDIKGTAFFDIEISAQNIGDDSVELGLKKVIDTAFMRGETHFIVNSEAVLEEKAFEGGEIPSVLLSPGDSPGERLYVHSDREANMSLDRLLLANWNRLDREEWDYTPEEGTNFNALPFSINDSALGFYWLPTALIRGETVYTGLALGPSDFTGEGEKIELPQETQVYIPADPALARLHVDEQLAYLELFLADLEELLDKEDGLSNEEILSLEERLEMLEQERREYEKLR